MLAEEPSGGTHEFTPVLAGPRFRHLHLNIVPLIKTAANLLQMGDAPRARLRAKWGQVNAQRRLQ
jgi:hypothetical protein